MEQVVPRKCWSLVRKLSIGSNVGNKLLLHLVWLKYGFEWIIDQEKIRHNYIFIMTSPGKQFLKYSIIYRL